MDTFIDKMAQKRNAQEMIRANSAAEAAKMEQMQQQITRYDGMMQEQETRYDEMMQEIRRINIKTAQNVDQVRDVLAQCVEKLKSIETEGGQTAEMEEQLAGIKTLLEERLAQSEEFMHKENVKVYRNVQAAFTEELEKQGQTQKGSRAPVGLSIAILIAVAADIVVSLLTLFMQLTNGKLF